MAETPKAAPDPHKIDILGKLADNEMGLAWYCGLQSEARPRSGRGDPPMGALSGLHQVVAAGEVFWVRQPGHHHDRAGEGAGALKRKKGPASHEGQPGRYALTHSRCANAMVAI
ncbi:hypothetical protein [Pseudooceanicola nanhaiensis]|uniref:hypothetical protein n=1 Tax=Pseudooceanicola nanhaiensis TaxID=375761 RepID=UPI0040583F55